MDKTRSEFQQWLESVLGSNNVFFQPPPTFKLSYPCIIYSRDDLVSLRADNLVHKTGTRYLVTYIDSNPDSSVLALLNANPRTRYVRNYRTDNLNHDVFNILTF